MGENYTTAMRNASVVFHNMIQPFKGRKGNCNGSLATTTRDSSLHDISLSFSRMVLPLAAMELEEYDEAIAEVTASSTHSSVSPSDFLPEEPKKVYSSIDLRATIPPVQRDDLRIINLIGNGSFCRVHLASCPPSLLPKDSCTSDTNSDEVGPRALLAVKSIDTNKITSASELIVAASELANEATILSELNHQNIVQLRGICSETFSESFGRGGFFLVFDILQETLSDHLCKWRHQQYWKERLYRKSSRTRAAKWSFLQRKGRSHASIEMRPDLDERKRRLYYRIQETVLGMVKGLEYLHSKEIVLRDLKPANIGYMDTSSIKYGTSTIDTSNHGNRTGSTVRLFDFGMAAKVEDINPLETCGSLRYMAPEVMTGEGYGLEVDVYSFGVILFEISSLCHPFTQTWMKRQKQMVRRLSKGIILPNAKNITSLVEDYRNQIITGELTMAQNLKKSVLCPELRSLIEECCARDPRMRPTFAQIRAKLDLIYTRLEANEDEIYFYPATSQ